MVRSKRGRQPDAETQRILSKMIPLVLVCGFYDMGDLNMVALSLENLEEFPPGVTHQYRFAIDKSVYRCIRREGDNYVVLVDMLGMAEHLLRVAVLDCCLWRATDGAHPLSGATDEMRETLLKELLEKYASDREECFVYPHVTEMRPAQEAYQRQWCISIGTFTCEVGLCGYNEDAAPILVDQESAPMIIKGIRIGDHDAVSLRVDPDHPEIIRLGVNDAPFVDVEPGDEGYAILAELMRSRQTKRRERRAVQSAMQVWGRKSHGKKK
jgi:hypothetical protein